MALKRYQINYLIIQTFGRKQQMQYVISTADFNCSNLINKHGS